MIAAEKLSKSFGDFKALKALSFQVRKGEIVGLLGPNGAGKTTLMRLLAGVWRADGGQASLNGQPIGPTATSVKQKVGYLPEGNPLYGELTVGESLAFSALLRGLTLQAPSVQRARALCDLNKLWRVPVEDLSKGWRQRLGFAQAILHDPPILLLDEPTDGLDFGQKRHLRLVLRQMRKKKAILMATHLIEEVESICDSIILMDEGRCVTQVSLKSLRNRGTKRTSWLLRLETRPKGAEVALRNLQELRDLKRCPEGFELVGKPKVSLEAAVWALAKEEGWRVKVFRPRPPSLEDLLEEARLDV